MFPNKGRRLTCMLSPNNMFNVCVLLLLWQQLMGAAGCGEYRTLSSSGSGSLSSPGFPAPYPSYTHCVWLLEAPTNHSVTLTVSTLKAEKNADTCQDYLEVRDGSFKSALHIQDCHLSASMTITSGNRWLWVRFKAKANTDSIGFIAQYSISQSGLPDSISPIIYCDSMKFPCGNKECIPRAYVCDDENDCGCDGVDCDEHCPPGLGWDKLTVLAVGISVGTFFFLLIFLGIGFLEIYLKQVQEKNYLKKMEEQKKKRKRKPVLNVEPAKETSEVKLPVPSDWTN